MHSKFALLLLAALPVFIFVVAPVHGEDPAESPETVRAIRFGTPMTLRWGVQHWVDEMYLPESGVLCRMEFDAKGVPLGGGMTANYSRRPAYLDKVVLLDIPTEEIEIPRKLADEIVSLAELTRKVQQASKRLSKSTLELGLLRRKAPQGASSFRFLK